MLELRQVTKTYQVGEEQVQALRSVSMDVERGTFAALVGESGSGKSTLMNIAGCLEAPSAGAVLLNGQDVSSLNTQERADLRCRRVGFIFQSFHLLPYLTALENVMLPMMFAGIERQNQMLLARDLLERVGLRDRMRHKPGELSGGQCQRVCIARALANRPDIILADEPTGNLDSAGGEGIMRLLRECVEKGITVLMVTHNPAHAAQCDVRFHISDGVLRNAG